MDMFENTFEEPLRLDPETKKGLLESPSCVRVSLSTQDGEEIGESFALTVADIFRVEGEWGQGWEDVELFHYDPSTLYVYSTAVLPQHQGKGLGSILTKLLSEKARAGHCTKLIGHATSTVMRSVRERAGAVLPANHPPHQQWGGSDRTAWFYVQHLPQSNDYNCGPTALSYLLQLHGTTMSILYLTDMLVTNPHNGTPLTKIESFLKDFGIEFDRQSKPPFLANVTFDGEAHYVVVTEMNDRVKYWDPGDATIHTMTRENFEKSWYSNITGIYGGTIHINP